MVAAKQIYSGFIDLVGVRERAQTDVALYWRALQDFQSHVMDYCDLLSGKEGRVYFFSDCAFFQARSAADLFEFLGNLRHRLLQDGLYFKAAVKVGGLEARAAHESPFLRSEAIRNTIREHLVGHYFGRVAAELFALQEELKGIGIMIDPTGMDDNMVNKYCVDSCFLPQAGNRRMKEFKDLRLQQDDMKQGILRELLRAFFMAKSRSKKVGRFYISLLVTWLQSVNLLKLNYSAKSDGDLISLMLHGGFIKAFGDVVGIELPYFVLLNRCYDVEKDALPDLYRDTFRYIKSQRSIVKWIDLVPKTILSQQNRDKYLEDLSKEMIGKSNGEVADIP